jgi:addiction module HigA family antidote
MKAIKKYPYNPDYAVPPGETVREVIETFGMTQSEFTVRLGSPVQTLNRIFTGEAPITNETSNRLETLTGTPASFWNKLESNYRGQLAKSADGDLSHKGTETQS